MAAVKNEGDHGLTDGDVCRLPRFGAVSGSAALSAVADAVSRVDVWFERIEGGRRGVTRVSEQARTLKPS